VGVGLGVWGGRDVWPIDAIANVTVKMSAAKIKEMIFMMSPA
jgi:hypothetical protein